MHINSLHCIFTEDKTVKSVIVRMPANSVTVDAHIRGVFPLYQYMDFTLTNRVICNIGTILEPVLLLCGVCNVHGIALHSGVGTV